MTRTLSEEHLSQIFENVLAQRAWSQYYPRMRHFARELDCQQGRPDFVASPARTPPLHKAKRHRLAEALHNPATARILSLAKRDAPRTEQYLYRASGLSAPVVRRSIATLESLAFLSRTPSETLILSPDFPVTGWELWAFEIKVEKWQRALYQALQYQAFAHRVAVVIPERWAHRVEAQAEKFRKLNVGAIALNEQDSTIRFIVRPVKRRPASRFHHLYALGRFVRTMTALPRTRGPRV